MAAQSRPFDAVAGVITEGATWNSGRRRLNTALVGERIVVVREEHVTVGRNFDTWERRPRGVAVVAAAVTGVEQ